MFVLVIAIDFYKLFQNRSSATRALDSESRAIMEVAKDAAVVFIIRVLRPKDGGADGAGEMLDVKLHAWRKRSA